MLFSGYPEAWNPTQCPKEEAPVDMPSPLQSPGLESLVALCDSLIYRGMPCYRQLQWIG